MNDWALKAENLAKRYQIGKAPQAPNGRINLLQRLASPFNYLATTLRPPSEDEIIWALRDITFDVKQGEVVGIIGKNGSGKSTLLKILSRITEPTRGIAWIRGRVGSLLEVGTGFHPELTGRENIFLNGAILGMKRAEIYKKFDEIVAFSEVEKFLDTQVKRYSSGMYIRLAFSVAAHLDPEILIVDEVLAVGDASFQKKCLGKMEDVAKEGRTVLFVSHNMVAIQNLCDRVIWINEGMITEEGLTSDVVSKYLVSSFSAMPERVWEDKSSAPGNDSVRLRRVCVRPENGSPTDVISSETPCLAEVEYWNLVPDTILHVTLHFYTEQQVIAFTSASIETDVKWRGKPQPAGLFISVCQIPGHFLNSGMYRLALLIVQDSDRVIFRQNDALSFNVIELEKRPGTWYGKEPGAVRPRLPWTTEWVGEEAILNGSTQQVR